MASGPTIIPTVSAQQFAARLASLYPNGWTSPEAKQAGNAYALLLAYGQSLNTILGQIHYAKAAVLIPTETSPELDLASQDFFGNQLPRPPGMNDADFAHLILSSLFQSAATRGALSSAITMLTGVQPRMIDPWAPGDTGALDAVDMNGNAVCFIDVDTRTNPLRVTGEERYTGFIETAAPPVRPALGGNPVPCMDDGLYIDIAGGLVADLQITRNSSVFDLINNLRAYGVTIGVKIVADPQ